MPAKPQVSIFWDASAMPRSTVDGYAVATAIRDFAGQLGIIKAFRLYVDLSGRPQGLPSTLGSELQCSGVSIIDTVSSGRPGACSKMLLADCFTHALDNPPSTESVMVFITADADIPYSISLLRRRGHQVVLACPPGSNPNLERLSSDFALNREIFEPATGPTHQLRDGPCCCTGTCAASEARVVHRASRSSSDHSMRSSFENDGPLRSDPAELYISKTSLDSCSETQFSVSPAVPCSPFIPNVQHPSSGLADVGVNPRVTSESAMEPIQQPRDNSPASPTPPPVAIHVHELSITPPPNTNAEAVDVPTKLTFAEMAIRPQALDAPAPATVLPFVPSVPTNVAGGSGALSQAPTPVKAALPKVPAAFSVLVKALKSRKGGGMELISRNVLEEIILARDPDVFVKAGVSESTNPMGQYLDKAQSCRLVNIFKKQCKLHQDIALHYDVR